MLKVRNQILELFSIAFENSLKTTGTICGMYEKEAAEYEWILINRFRYSDSEIEVIKQEIETWHQQQSAK